MGKKLSESTRRSLTSARDRESRAAKDCRERIDSPRAGFSDQSRWGPVGPERTEALGKAAERHEGNAAEI